MFAAKIILLECKKYFKVNAFVMKKRISDSAAHKPTSTPSFLLVGQRECIIEGKCELVLYSDSHMAFGIFQGGKIFSIYGTSLSLACLTQGRCAVCGCIVRLEFEDEKELSAGGDVAK